MSSAIVKHTSQTYSGFSPRSIPSCMLWFDAADTSSIVATGSTVTQWNDKSGNGTHLTAVSSPQTGITTTNGLNTMNLTAGGYFTRTTGFTFPAQYSVFTVAYTNATGLTTLLSASGDLAFLYRFPNSILWSNGGGSWKTFTTNIPSAPLALIGVTNTGSAGTLYTNGNFRQTISGTTVARTQFAIGNRLLNLNEPWNGFVCEVLVFDTVISTGQRQAVEGYLARKWGLTGNILDRSSFLPTSIANCTLWLDGADASTFTLSGSNVTQWNDKSGGGFNATATSTPTRSTYNGYPVVSFNGSSQFMSSTHTIPRSTHTLIAVHRPAVINANRQGNTSLFRYQGANSYVVFPYMNEATPRGYISNANVNIAANASTLVENSVTTAFNLIMAVIASGSQTIFNSGEIQSTNTQTLTSTPVSDALTIGRWSGGAAEYYQGDLAEMIVYSRNITISERTQIEEYLSWKWRVNIRLPATHPYKTLPLSTRFFQPTDIDGCTLWLDASDLNTLTLSGTNISQWNDKSGSGFNATSATGPTLSTYNGYPVLSFNGSSHTMSSTHTVPRATHTLIAVHRPATITGNAQGNTSLFRYQVSSNYIVFPHMQGTSRRGYITSADGTSLDVNNSTMFENSVTTALNLIMAVIVSGSQLIFNNGTQQASNTQPMSAGTSDPLKIGSIASTEYYQGDLAEMIVYSRNLTAGERQLLEGYLAWKWGLRLSLPATQPFRLFRTPTVLFNPLQISNCSLWLDAADVTTLTFSGSNISQWNDKSGNSFNLTQGTSGSQPLLTSGYVSFASDRHFNIPQAAINNATAYSMFFVMNPISSTNWILAKQHNGVNTYNLLSMSRLTDSGGASIAGITNYLYWRPYNAGASPNSGTALSTSTPQLLEIVYNGTTVIMYRNGTQLSSTSASGTGAIQNATGATNFTMGVWNKDSVLQNSGVTNFQLGEMAYFNKALSVSERTQVEGYLAWKWRLQTNLPSNHPYYDTRS